MTERMNKVQQSIDEVLLVQRHIITKIETAMAYQQKYPNVFAPERNDTPNLESSMNTFN